MEPRNNTWASELTIENIPHLCKILQGEILLGDESKRSLIETIKALPEDDKVKKQLLPYLPKAA